MESEGFISVEGDFQNLECDPVKQTRFNGPLFLAGNLVNNDSLKFSASLGSGNQKKARLVLRNAASLLSAVNITISGTAPVKLWAAEIDKTGGSVTLGQSVFCYDTLEFKTGHIRMNGHMWKLIDASGAPSVINHPYIKNERSVSQFMALGLSDTGKVHYETTYTNTLDINPANIGVMISGTVDLGSPLKIVRGFSTQVNAGKTGLHTYYDIYSPYYSLESNTITMRYSFNDLQHFSPGYITAAKVRLMVSAVPSDYWWPLPVVASTLVANSGAAANGVLVGNLSEFAHPNLNISGHAFRVTAADINCPGPPTSALTNDTAHICSSQTIVLDAGNNTSVSNTSLKWDWNSVPPVFDRTFQATPNSQYQKVTVRLTDIRGCVSRDSIIIAPEASYPVIKYLNHLNVCHGDSVVIKDTVTITSGSFNNKWIFSDGDTIDTNSNLFWKKFAGPGKNAVQLISTSNHGCKTNVSDTNIIVYPLPLASFTYSYSCTNSVSVFNNNSLSNFSGAIIAANNWDFGVGNSTLTSPVFNYTAAGVFPTKLTVITSLGCRDSVSQAVTIYPRNISAFLKTNACFNSPVNLTNLSTCSTGSCSYFWDFGDGSHSSSPSLNKLYTAPGLYPVKLKVTAPIGCEDSIIINVYVNENPVSQFAISPPSICENESVLFANSSTIAAGSITANIWNFANNTSSISTNGSATYTTPGLFHVTLTAVSDSACQQTVVKTLTVFPKPHSSFHANSPCLENPVQFVSNSSGTGLTYNWDYGNTITTGFVSANAQSYSYNQAGTYSTSLIVKSVDGCLDTSQVMVTVKPNPTAGLSGTLSTCGTKYILDALNPGATYFWHPGAVTTRTLEVNTSSLQKVIISATNGCQATETVYVQLNNVVTPLLGNDTSVCGKIILDAGYPGSNFIWNTAATTQSIVVLNSGTYSVTVTDQNACTGSDIINVQILNKDTVKLGNDTSICRQPTGFKVQANSTAPAHLWSTGAVTNTTVVFNSSHIWVESISLHGCRHRDSIYIFVKSPPQVLLPDTVTSCGPATLTALSLSTIYSWDTGSSTNSVVAETSDKYNLKVTDATTGCTVNDSVVVTVNPIVVVNLGKDTAVCNNTFFVLNARNPGHNYEWTTGSFSQTITPASNGLYGVKVMNQYGCSATDFIQVTYTPAPQIELGEELRYLCEGRPVVLTYTGTGSISWRSNSGLVSSNKSINLFLPGKYWANISENGCSASDTVSLAITTNTIKAEFLASTVDTVNKPVKFVNLSEPVPLLQTWYFGDGLTSTDPHPEHTYYLPNTFSVTLEVSNGFCSDRITKQLSVLFRRGLLQTGPVSILEIKSLKIYPNPASDDLHYRIELNDFADVELGVFDLSGKKVFETEHRNQSDVDETISLHGLSNGVYLISISAEGLKGNIRETARIIKN